LTSFPSNMLSLLQGGDELLDTARKVVEWVRSNDVDPGIKVAVEDVVLQAPISNVSKVVGIGLNYADHCREQNIPLPESVLLFAKFPSSIIGPDEDITWDHEVSTEVDYEAELAVIIGKEAFRVGPQDVWEYIAGYSIVNDVSARDVQFSDRQWVRGKSFDTFCPIGPYLATRDEIENTDNLKIQTRLNGELVQNSSTKEMVFKIPDIVSFITKSITLVPGDIICTGTPDGVGYFRDPKVLLKPGDIVEIEIENLGVLKNPIA
jgi:2-keto-4-pentenoate hydratase/2-oxohepta-3-ene-1,7-dioic acid hydratase in catechol pathway